MTFKSGRGGHREGAGRPVGTKKKITKKPFQIRVHPQILAWYRRQPQGQRNTMIEKAIIEYYKLHHLVEDKEE